MVGSVCHGSSAPWCHPLACQVLGTPTKEQLYSMNKNYTEFKFPQVKQYPWSKVRCHVHVRACACARVCVCACVRAIVIVSKYV